MQLMRQGLAKDVQGLIHVLLEIKCLRKNLSRSYRISCTFLPSSRQKKKNNIVY